MAKILVFGNERTNVWAKEIANVEINHMSSFTLNENDEAKMSEIIEERLSSNDFSALVFDLDNLDVEVCLAFATCVRLSIVEVSQKALLPIVFATKLSIDQFLSKKYSNIILTNGVVFENPDVIKDGVDCLKRLEADDYQEGFLNRIKILPNATEGRHSLANQWGASVLERYTRSSSSVIEKIPTIQKARRTLYFKYTLVSTLNKSELSDIINKSQNKLGENRISVNANGAKILLIDDEADRGWNDVLKSMIRNYGDFQTINEQVSDYEHFSDEAKGLIANGDFDLIFLDLRMNGVKEENIFEANKFSGMKILNKIKSLNQGTQVIMFTASNKIWNLKPLLDAGADGYYVKESPEYLFPVEVSKNQTLALRDTINKCLSKIYLRDVFRKKECVQNHLKGEDWDDVVKQLDTAYHLIVRANSKEEYAFAYVALEQIFEMVSKNLLYKEGDDYYIESPWIKCKWWSIKNDKLEENHPKDKKDYPQWMRITSLYCYFSDSHSYDFAKKVNNLINIRNDFIHNNKMTDIYTPSAFRALFELMYEFLMKI